MPKRLTNLRVSEISLVDRPANPGARVVLAKRDDEEPYWKREFSADERRAAASSGAALPDGSFPIKTKQDLHNAMRAIGRAKDPGKAKAHIRSRARALGLAGDLTEAFKSAGQFARLAAYFTKDAGADPDDDGDDDSGDGDDWDDDATTSPGKTRARKDIGALLKSYGALATAYDEILSEPDTPNKLAALETSRKQFLAQIAQDLQKGRDMTLDLKKAFGLAETASDEDVQKALGGLVTKVESLTTENVALKREAAIAKMSAKHSAFMNDPGAKLPKGGKDAFADMSPEDRDDHMSKNPISKSDAEKAVEFEKAARVALEQKVEKMEDERALDVVAKRIAVWGGSPEHAAILHKLAKADKPAAEKMEATLKGLAEQVKTGKVFEEFGTKQQTQGTAKGAIDARVAEMRKSDAKLTSDRAIAKIAESRDPADQELWKRYREETEKRAA